MRNRKKNITLHSTTWMYLNRSPLFSRTNCHWHRCTRRSNYFSHRISNRLKIWTRIWINAYNWTNRQWRPLIRVWNTNQVKHHTALPSTHPFCSNNRCQWLMTYTNRRQLTRLCWRRSLSLWLDRRTRSILSLWPLSSCSSTLASLSCRPSKLI